MSCRSLNAAHISRTDDWSPSSAAAAAACEIEQARLLTLKAADRMDRGGNKAAKELIAMIKIVAPAMACRVLDRTIQVHGGAGYCTDFPVERYFRDARFLLYGGGTHEVLLNFLGRLFAEGKL